MHSFLCDDAGIPLVDFVGRYERLQKDFDEICFWMDRPLRSLPRLNTRLVDLDLGRFYTPERRQRVIDYYAFDLEIFGYDPDRG